MLAPHSYRLAYENWRWQLMHQHGKTSGRSFKPLTGLTSVFASTLSKRLEGNGVILPLQAALVNFIRNGKSDSEEHFHLSA
jgi:hypothetical protein